MDGFKKIVVFSFVGFCFLATFAGEEKSFFPFSNFPMYSKPMREAVYYEFVIIGEEQKNSLNIKKYFWPYRSSPYIEEALISWRESGLDNKVITKSFAQILRRRAYLYDDLDLYNFKTLQIYRQKFDVMGYKKIVQESDLDNRLQQMSLFGEVAL